MLDKTAAYLEALYASNIDRDNPIAQEAREEVKQLRTLPEIVVLAGSSRFKQAFESEEYRLALTGHIVLGKHVYKPGEEWPLDEYAKGLLHAVQFRKVEIAHRVHVINVDGYVGQDTYNLIKFAIRHDKPISFLEDKVQLLKHGSIVTVAHFLQGTRRTVEFESATLEGA